MIVLAGYGDKVRPSAIVLAFGAEPDLVECTSALLAQGCEVIVVDNGAAADAIEAVGRLGEVHILHPGTNLGYAQGCNFGASAASGDVLLFVNSDAIVQLGAVSALVERVADPSIGLACASIRLADDPHLLNSVGNPVQFLMFSWVGHYREPAELHQGTTEISSISGVAFAVRREVWERLGGFDPMYFAYCEDVYLSWRSWQAGLRVVHDPAAIVWHRYEFNRNATKNYLLERNRLMNLITLPASKTRRLVALPAVIVELGVLAAATRDGWARDKIDGWRWLIAHRVEISQRRAAIQAARTVPDSSLLPLWRGPLDPPRGLGPGVPAIVSRILAAYWSVVQRWI